MLGRTVSRRVLSLVLMLPSLAAAQHRSPDVSTQTAPLEDRYFDADGVRIRYLDVGSGDPVVLVHGFALDIELNWAPTGLLESLPGEFRLIALDLRGHGKSDKPAGREHYGPKLASDVVRLLDHLEIERAHIVGYSMGGGIALKLLAEHPERVWSAVLGGAGWSPPGARPPEEIAGWVGGLEAVAGGEGSVTDVLWNPRWPEPPPEMRAALDANDAGALASVLTSLGGLSVSPTVLGGSSTAILAVVGDEDFVLPAVYVLAGVRPDAEVALLPGSNHLTALLDPGFEQAVLGFLRAQP